MISMSPSEAQMLQSFSSQIDGGSNGFSSSTPPTPPTSGAPITHPVTARSRIKKKASKQQAFGDSHGSGIEAKARLRKACDLCSARKVKCDETGPPCRACAGLGTPCTFDRPSRRRGPPNRHAELVKKRRYDSPGTSGASAPNSPTHAAHTLASFSQHQVLSAEAILPFPILQLLLDDYFTYIHPLVPVPHEPSFRAALHHREDLNNPTFLALLASMVGCLVASFPRRPRVHLQAQHMEHYFPDSLSLIDRCRKVAIEARGPGYLDGDLTVHDAVINYLQGLTSGYTYNWQSCRVYFGQSLTIARIIGLHKVRGLGSSNSGGYSSQFNVNPDGDATHEDDEDLVIRELGRRTFWLLFVGVKSVQQFGASSGDFWMPPATPSEPYPPLPLEVDDQYLTPTGILPQPPGVISMLVGFNANVRIYSTYNTLSTMELAYGVDDVFDWDRQKRVLEQSLHAVKQVLEGIPLELQLYPESHPTEFPDPETLPDMNGFQIRPSWERNWQQEQLQRALIDRKKAQYEIQKANIYVSQLSTRSYVVEKYWNLFDAQHRMSLTNHSNAHSPGVFAAGVDDYAPPDDEKCGDGFDPTKLDMATEREHIVRDLLSLLGTISQVDIEPNGASFINKVRQIASTLLDVPPDRKGSYAIRAEEYLHAFLNILMKLERSSPMEGDDRDRILTEEEEEEVEFRHWADFRIALNKFVMSGGFANEG